MRPQTSLFLLSPLLKKPFFTSKEAKEVGVHPAMLSHYVKTGHLKRVRRGVYQAADYQNPSAFSVGRSYRGGILRKRRDSVSHFSSSHL